MPILKWLRCKTGYLLIGLKLAQPSSAHIFSLTSSFCAKFVPSRYAVINICAGPIIDIIGKFGDEARITVSPPHENEYETLQKS